VRAVVVIALLCLGFLGGGCLDSDDDPAKSSGDGDHGEPIHPGERPTWPPAGARVATCLERIGGGAPVSNPRYLQQSVLAGPIVIFPARRDYVRHAVVEPVSVGPRGPRYSSSQMLISLADRGRPELRAVVAIAPSAREHAAFIFRKQYREAGWYVAEGESALALRGCRGRGPDLGPEGDYTSYATGFLVAGRRCVPIEVTVVGRPRPIDRVIRYGVRRCDTA
jgi:hypothetical protein